MMKKKKEEEKEKEEEEEEEERNETEAWTSAFVRPKLVIPGDRSVLPYFP
ncbi:hypothetical protein ALC53_05359 [Atta colombica]|uniref:Uncharacterized protein n=1 Tax=Atta colombica TaxID=520822 RepID=A0A195BIT2_9HYME|nr:hypothetical protein ALC53_05359 [Atta colombica]